MTLITTIINIIALIVWISVCGHSFYLMKLTQIARIKIEQKRDVFIKLIAPIWTMTLFYISLLLFWIVFDYDQQIDMWINLSWSIFHILTPITFSLYLHREQKFLKDRL